MKSLNVPFLENFNEESDLSDVSQEIDAFTLDHHINEINWNEYAYRPGVSFRIAHGDSAIFLKYYVTEENIRAVHNRNNGMVCEDSCVEFFVSPADDGIYYNFEFNCIGTCRIGVGTSRGDNRVVEPEIVDSVRRLASLGTHPFAEKPGTCSWELLAAIPLEVFTRHKIDTLRGKVFRANFYKCGDKLSTPHYLTWNRVDTAKPDFHRPEYFGEIIFK